MNYYLLYKMFIYEPIDELTINQIIKLHNIYKKYIKQNKNYLK